MDAVEIIKLMLAPGVMLNCCGLFLLGMNNKYSVVVGRIRNLDEEKRTLKKAERQNTISSHDQKRLANINMQIGKLIYRVKLVRNAVVSYTVAVAFFILNCITIGVNSLFKNSNSGFSISIILFFIGLAFVFAGVAYATKEAIKGYEIVKIEVKDID
ncbi:MAG: DUF2721 domain-containing protein [Bacteroidales bacterium]